MEVMGIRRGWEGLTHVKPGGELDPDYLRPLDRRNTRTIDRTGGTMLHTSRTNPARMKPGVAACLALARAGAERYRTDDGRYDLTPVVLEHLEALGHRRTRADRRRRHAVVRADPRRQGRAARRDPQDDGQRRARHGVLHRLLVGDHAGEGAHRPPADDARQPRADRRVPDLRARRGLLRAVRGLRDVGPLPDPRGAIRPRRPRGDHGRRPPRSARAGTRSSITAEGAIWHGREPRRGRRGGRVRTSTQGERRRGARVRADAPDRASRRSRSS